MYKFYFISLVCLFSCCNNNDESFVIDTSFSIEITGANGEDLLDPNIENSFDWTQIRIYPSLEDLDSPYFKSNLDYPYGYKIFKDDNMELYQFLITMRIDNNQPFMIKFDDHEIDTVKCYIEKTDSFERTEKIWYNDIEVWNFSSKRAKIIRITKE